MWIYISRYRSIFLYMIFININITNHQLKLKKLQKDCIKNFQVMDYYQLICCVISDSMNTLRAKNTHCFCLKAQFEDPRFRGHRHGVSVPIPAVPPNPPTHPSPHSFGEAPSGHVTPSQQDNQARVSLIKLCYCCCMWSFVFDHYILRAASDQNNFWSQLTWSLQLFPVC